MQQLPHDLLVKLARMCPLPSAGAFALSFKRASVAVREAMKPTEKMVADIEALDDKEAELLQKRLSKSLRERKRRFEASLSEEFEGILKRSSTAGATCTREGCTAPATDYEDVRLCDMCYSLFSCSDCSEIHRGATGLARCTLCGANTPTACGVYHGDRNEGDNLLCRNCIDDFCEGAL